MSTIERLDGEHWPDPGPDATLLIRRCVELRRKELSAFTVEDMRIMLGQQIGVAALLPLAVAVLLRDPLAEGDLYPGDLRDVVLRLPETAWSGLERQRRMLDDRLAAREDFVLRPADRDDVEFLTDMLVAAVNWPADRDWSRERVMSVPALAHYVAGWLRPGDLGVVAHTRADEPIGAAWVRYLPADDPGYGYVRADVPELSIGVIPSARGRGVGRALLRAALAEARDAGAPAVSLSVERANPAARLYAAEGFRVVGSAGDADTMIAILSAA